MVSVRQLGSVLSVRMDLVGKHLGMELDQNSQSSAGMKEAGETAEAVGVEASAAGQETVSWQSYC